MTTQLPHITISAKRWFDRNGGNTYHSVKVWADDNVIGINNFAYGYDEQFLHSAFVILQEAGIYPKTGERANGVSKDELQFWSDKREKRQNFSIHVYDVPRKRDLAFD